MNNISLIVCAIICFALNITALVISIKEGNILLAIGNAIMLIAMTKTVIAEVKR